MTPIARLTTLALAAATLAALGGCSEPYRRPMDGRPSANPVAVNAPFDPLFESVDRTLRDHRFGTEANPRLGEVRTRALTGQQVWEFWRSDSVGLYNHMESSLHTILRTADVRVYPVRDKAGQPLADQYFLEVRVYTDRWSVPERDLTAANQISSAYGERGLVNELQLRSEGADGPHAVFLGRDALLEDWLIRDILDTLAKQPIHSTPARELPDDKSAAR